MPEIIVDIGDDQLHFRAYPYPAASIFPGGVVPADDVRDIDPTSAPPEVRLATCETLFVPAPQRDDLARFGERNGLPLLRRPDLWGALLEPFLDTEFTPEDVERTRTLLARFGLDDDEVTQIRERFAPVMTDYNLSSMLWDWFHLGLTDLLDALLGHLSGRRHRLEAQEFAEAYFWAMALADRSKEASQMIDT